MAAETYNNGALRTALASRRGMNVTRLCSELGMSRAHFYDVVNGTAPAARATVERVAQALGVDLGDLYPQRGDTLGSA